MFGVRLRYSGNEWVRLTFIMFMSKTHIIGSIQLHIFYKSLKPLLRRKLICIHILMKQRSTIGITILKTKKIPSPCHKLKEIFQKWLFQSEIKECFVHIV